MGYDDVGFVGIAADSITGLLERTQHRAAHARAFAETI
jgi:hypothetical protein